MSEIIWDMEADSFRARRVKSLLRKGFSLITLLAIASMFLTGHRLYIEQDVVNALLLVGSVMALTIFVLVAFWVRKYQIYDLFGKSKRGGSEQVGTYAISFALCLFCAWMLIGRLVPYAVIEFDGHEVDEQAPVLSKFSTQGSKGGVYYWLRLSILASYSSQAISVNRDQYVRANNTTTVFVHAIKSDLGMVVKSVELQYQ